MKTIPTVTEDVWVGGLDSEGQSVEVFFEEGVINLGVHTGKVGAMQELTPDNAVWIARLLLHAASESAERFKQPIADDHQVNVALTYLE